MTIFRKIKELNKNIDSINSFWEKAAADKERFLEIANPLLGKMREDLLAGKKNEGEVIVTPDDYDFIVYYLKEPKCMGYDLVKRGV